MFTHLFICMFVYLCICCCLFVVCLFVHLFNRVFVVVVVVVCHKLELELTLNECAMLIRNGNEMEDKICFSFKVCSTCFNLTT